MLSLLACALSLQVPILQPPRLRTILPNGAVVLVEKQPDAKRISIELFVSSWNTSETESTHGYRHLLEHLIAKGRHKDLDARLESHGAFLTAQTSRDFTNFELTLRPTDLNLGMGAVSELLQLGEVTQEEIAKEAEIIRQELALKPISTQLSETAWTTAFGADGLDPGGNADTIARATPAQIYKLHKDSYIGPNLVIVISGPVELEEGTKAAAAVLGVASGGPIPDPKLRRGAPGSAVVNAEADARGALVTDFGAPDTAAKLAAALAIGAQAGSSFVMYTPTERGGVILVGAAAQKGIVGRLADSATPNALFAAGRSLARAWIERQITGSEANGFFRGELLVLGPGLRPDSMLNNLDNMTPAQFAKAVAAFRNPLCVMVTGK